MLDRTRRDKVVEIVKEKGEVTVKELAEFLGVTSVTVRKDLKELERLGLIVRTHGGAVAPSHTRVEWNFIQKSKQHVEEKRAIAKKALEFVKEGDSILLDSGTTTLAMAREIKKRKLHPLTVVTNNLFIATELVGTSVDLIVLGGKVRENSFSLIGAFCEDNLKRIYVDKAFIGATGFSSDGFMTPDINEAQVKSMMVSQASEIFIVVDSSKFAHPSFAMYTHLNRIDHVITDWKIPPEVEENIKSFGVNVIKALKKGDDEIDTQR